MTQSGLSTTTGTTSTVAFRAGVLILALLLTACQTTATQPLSGFVPGAVNPTAGAQSSATSQEIRQVHQWLFDGEYERASKWLNQALSRRLDDAELHFLNGLTYHLLSQTDISRRDVAAEGYNLSLKFDNTQWVPRYFLGVLAMESKQYASALIHFSEAALYNPDSERLLTDMAASAYLARQPDLAAGIYRQLLEKSPDNPHYRANYALTLAALNQPEQALAQLSEVADAPQKKYARKRIGDWQRFHQTAGLNAAQAARPEDFIKAQSSYDEYEDEYSDDYSDDYADDDGGGESSGELPRSNKQVILDVVFIRSEETITSSRGINLLKTLQLQYNFFDVLPSDGSFDSALGVVDSVTETFDDENILDSEGKIIGTRVRERISNSFRAPALHKPRISSSFLQTEGRDSAVNYSLNIANNGSSRNEVLARPSLTVADGETSQFFSGVNVLAATGGADTGSPLQIERDIGVKLNVQPLFLDDEKIQLKINAERTFLTVPDETSVTFTDRIDTSKTEVNTTVVMKMGETLVLSGLSEKETGTVRDGVPILQDIPIIQYLFSNKTTLDFQRSVMILVTPRNPAYVYKDVGDSVDGEFGTVEEFKAVHQDWFKPYPNWASVFNHLDSNQLYREFRTGDVKLEKWESRQTLDSRLKEAIESFYY